MSWPNSDKNHLLVTSEQMKHLEQKMFDSGLPVAALMEKAGLAMASWLMKQNDLLLNGALVLVGPGHNGGDGLVVARELHLAGVRVRIWCPFGIAQPLTNQQFSHAEWLGVECLTGEPDVKADELWVEALFGLAQNRPLPSKISTLFESREIHMPGKLVSLDVPAGLCPDTGKPFDGRAAVASRTLSVGLYKKGLIQDDALPYVGEIILFDIGIPKRILADLSHTNPKLISPNDLLTLELPNPGIKATKYERGRLLVIAGSELYKGAANLSLQGALASGTGSIQAIVPASVADSLWQMLPEVVFRASIKVNSKDPNKGSSSIPVEINKLDAILFGPGLTLSKDQWSLFSDSLRCFKGLLVLDADGLNLLAVSKYGWCWLKDREGPTWITPHQSEFSRLFPDLKGLDPLEAALEAAKISGVNVLLKGAHSVVADENGRSWQLGKVNPFVARAGLGDLLAGYAAGLGSIGIATNKNCDAELLAAAMFLHSQSAVRTEKGTSASLVASSLGEMTMRIQNRNGFDRHINMF